MNSQNDLMNTAITDKNNLWSKVKQMRDNKSKNNDIPYIETMAGRFEENEVLEGFRQNTELLCNKKDNKNFIMDFYNLSEEVNQIIFDISSNQEINIPFMKLEDLK